MSYIGNTGCIYCCILCADNLQSMGLGRKLDCEVPPAGLLSPLDQPCFVTFWKDMLLVYLQYNKGIMPIFLTFTC